MFGGIFNNACTFLANCVPKNISLPIAGVFIWFSVRFLFFATMLPLGYTANTKMKKIVNENWSYIILTLAILLVVSFFITVEQASAHRSGCHRWHSCPSDTGSYTCGDLGYPCQYPTYPKSGGVVYPPNNYYKDCYTCAWKKVPANDTRVWKRQLQIDTSGTDVIYLQKALNIEGVYPEALYTGYYGPLTERAVKRFQKKYDIVSYGTPSSTGYGRVGWKTMAVLNLRYILK